MLVRPTSPPQVETLSTAPHAVSANGACSDEAAQSPLICVSLGIWYALLLGTGWHRL